MKTYRGTAEHTVVWQESDGKPWRFLSRRLDLRRHSPTGFSWGYGGSGPAQLALALLAHVTDDDARALASYQGFKFGVIGYLKGDWELSAGEILFMLETIEEKKKG